MRHQSLFTYSKNKQTSFDIFCFEGARIRLNFAHLTLMLPTSTLEDSPTHAHTYTVCRYNTNSVRNSN